MGLNASPALVKQYYLALHAPQKQFVWFERSGHNVSFQEPNRFNNFLIHTVLRQNPR
jgi:pimeloyl-ACP methyl ester carboxylesterase